MKAIASVFAALALSACVSTGGPAACDRACLGGQLESYLSAVRSHDMSKAQFAADFRATENGVTVAAGEGIAKTITDSYFDGLQRHDGSLAPKIPGCNRLENGTRVTNRAPRAPAPGVSAAEAAVEFGATDCTSGLDRMTQIAGVARRRFPLVDEEAGVVMGIGLFLRPPGQTGNFAKRNLLTEFFGMKGGKVSGIYAVMRYLDANAPDETGW